ncbi:MAG: lipopolysaccharide heptosyltransferase I [Methylobacillus sp.]|jgi:heptosyltransferase-1|nr:lipopolysaccharide heptosyltransferase I [Methylobacillus sp.]
MRLLLVKTSSMGDLVHNMPMIADIRHRFPDAIMDWVAEESFVEIARMNTEVARIIPVNMRRWKRNLGSCLSWREFSAFRRELKSEHYDAALDTQGLFKSALICRWSRSPSHGQNNQTAREAVAGWLYTHPHDIPRNLHAATRNRLLAARALGYELPDTPPRYDLQLPPAALPFTPSAPYAVILHGTARAAKLWPVEHWIAFCRELAQTHPTIFLPWGNDEERARAEKIAAAAPGCQTLPRMTLTQLAHLLQGAGIVVGLDTGLMHLAVGLGKPTLAIFCDTDIWQAGTCPPAGARALTVGGKGVVPAVSEAVASLHQVLAPMG